MEKINNKVLILGGTSGIGLETAKRFSKENKVFVVGRNEEKGKDASSLENISFIRADISTKEDREELLKILEKEKITKIIHCAGIFSQDKTPEYEQEYENVKRGGVEVMQILGQKDEATHVLAISSLYTFLPNSDSYKLEKRVHEDLEKTVLAINKDNEKLVVNCVAPGLVDTKLAREGFGKRFHEILKDSPGSRILEPEEIAEVIYWLTNQNVIKNQVIPVDGGYLKNLKQK